MKTQPPFNIGDSFPDSWVVQPGKEIEKKLALKGDEKREEDPAKKKKREADGKEEELPSNIPKIIGGNIDLRV